MKDFRSRKKTKKNILYSPLFLVFVFILLIFFVRSAFNSYKIKEKADREHQKIQKQYLDLVKKKDSLEKKINILKTEEGLRQEHKKRFNVIEEGEKIIHILDKKAL